MQSPRASGTGTEESEREESGLLGESAVDVSPRTPKAPVPLPRPPAGERYARSYRQSSSKGYKPEPMQLN